MCRLVAVAVDFSLHILHSAVLDRVHFDIVVPVQGCDALPAQVGDHGVLEEDVDKGPADVGAAQAVDEEVQGEAEQLEVVGAGAEDGEPRPGLELIRHQDGEEGCRGGADNKQDHDCNQHDNQHPLLGVVEAASRASRRGSRRAAPAHHQLQVVSRRAERWRQLLRWLLLLCWCWRR